MGTLLVMSWHLIWAHVWKYYKFFIILDLPLLPIIFLAEKFEKWDHIWCQVMTKSDPIIGVDFDTVDTVLSHEAK